jgi:hypothetical protein
LAHVVVALKSFLQLDELALPLPAIVMVDALVLLVVVYFRTVVLTQTLRFYF